MKREEKIMMGLRMLMQATFVTYLPPKPRYLPPHFQIDFGLEGNLCQ
jgi:hypothetical protein